MFAEHLRRTPIGRTQARWLEEQYRQVISLSGQSQKDQERQADRNRDELCLPAGCLRAMNWPLQLRAE